MPVAEPNNELWTAVKALANPWPPDDEDNLKKLAKDWRAAAKSAQAHAADLAKAQGAAAQGWQDPAGQTMGQQIQKNTVPLENQRQGAEQQAMKADQYATALTNVKNAVVNAINTNLPTYLQLGNPMYGAVGVAKQKQFAADLAAKLKAMVDGQAKNMKAPPAAAPESDSTIGKIGDIAGTISAIAGAAALIPGVDVVAAPVALLSGGVALTMHAIAMFCIGDFKGKWVGVLGDGLGLIPGGKLVKEIAEGANAVRGTDVVSGPRR